MPVASQGPAFLALTGGAKDRGAFTAQQLSAEDACSLTCESVNVAPLAITTKNLRGLRTNRPDCKPAGPPSACELYQLGELQSILAARVSYLFPAGEARISCHYKYWPVDNPIDADLRFTVHYFRNATLTLEQAHEEFVKGSTTSYLIRRAMSGSA